MDEIILQQDQDYEPKITKAAQLQGSNLKMKLLYMTDSEAYEYLNKIQKNKDFIDALVSNAETANYDEQYKKILIDPTRDRVVLNKGGFSDVQKNGDKYDF